MSALDGVKVGDMLAFDERGREGPVIVRVERLTPKHAVTGDVKWRISDGSQVGAGNWMPCFARIATPEDLHQVEARKSREYARSKFGHMTDDQAIRVADFIREMLRNDTKVEVICEGIFMIDGHECAVKDGVVSRTYADKENKD